MNKIIKTLISSNLLLNSGWGLLAPVFAIFVLENIAVGSAQQGAKIVGFASLTYWALKSFLQIPIGKFLDKNHGERDDFWFVAVGIFFTGLTPFLLLLASQAWHIYAFEALHALGMAMVIPSWSAIFTRHIDKGKEAIEWGTNSTVLGLGAGIAGAVGGILAAIFGFKLIFVLVGSITIASSFFLLFIRKDIFSKNKKTPRTPLFNTPFIN